MNRVLTALAVALAAIFLVSGCNDYGNTFQGNTGAVITTLSPSNITAGSPAFTLTISGSGFVAKTYITWNGMKLATTDIDDSAGDVLQVTAQVPASLVAKAGQALILTHNPFSGAGNNGLSNPINFIINPASPPNPQPLLQSINPMSITAGSVASNATFPLTLTGANFITNSDPTQASMVFWNTTSTTLPLAAGSVPTSSQMIVSVPGTLISSAGTANIFVVNPPNTSAGGGTSSPIAFTINPAQTPAVAKLQAQAAAQETPALSADGRYVAYTAGDGEHTQIYLRDTCAGAPAGCTARTAAVSTAPDGDPANDDSHTPSMSADGRYVAFSSAATNLLSTSTASAALGRQIYLRDTCTGAEASCVPSTALVSTDASGQLTGLESILPSVSASGRFVAFVAISRSKSVNGTTSASSSIAAPASSSVNSGYQQIFVRDTCLGSANCTAATSRISLQPGDGSAASPTAGAAPAVSGDARKIALNGGGTAVLFTQSVAVDDRVFVAALQSSH